MAPAAVGTAPAFLALGVLGGLRAASRRSTATSRCSAASADLDQAQWDVEAATLREAAAQLRAEVDKIEAELCVQREQEQKKWFRIFDIDRSGTIDAEELRLGLKEMSGEMLDDSMAQRVLKELDMNQDGVLHFEEFNTKSIEATVERLKAEKRAEEDAAWLEECKQRAAEREEKELERRKQAYYMSLPEGNEDTSLLTRVASCFAYLLPLADGFAFALPLATLNPEVHATFLSVMVPIHALTSIPFARIIFFIGMMSIADNTQLPKLLRFNMRQAVVLEATIGFVQLLQVVVTLLTTGGHVPADYMEQWGSNVVVFVVLFASVAYAMASSLAGEEPKGIPYISAYTARYMAPTRPRDFAPDGSQLEDKSSQV